MTKIIDARPGNGLRIGQTLDVAQTPKTILRQMAEFQRAIGQLRGKNVLLTAHIELDGDGLCSMFAMSRILDEFGVKAVMVHPEPIPTYLKFLPGVSAINRSIPAGVKFSGAIVFDTPVNSKIDRDIYKFMAKNIPADQIMEIDHHLGKGNFRIGKGPALIDSVSSAAELVYEFAEYCQVSTPWDFTLFCYVGIITDTGNLEYLKGQPFAEKTRRIAEKLRLRGSLKTSKIQKLIWSLTPFEVTLIDLAFEEHLSMLDGVLRYTIIDKSLVREAMKRVARLKRESIRKPVFEAIADKLGEIEGTEIVILFREMENNTINVNIKRYNSDIDVSRIAASFGGGGHKVAAGFTLKGQSIEEVVKRLMTKGH